MARHEKTEEKAAPKTRHIGVEIYEDDDEFGLLQSLARRWHCTVADALSRVIRGEADRLGIPATEEANGGVEAARTPLPVRRSIVRDEKVCGGVPVLEGTRIGVHDVVSYLKIYGEDPDRIREKALPDLTAEDIRVALAYYADHRHQIEGILRDQEEFYQDLAKQARPR